MALMENHFGAETENAIASYDAVDIFEGTGTIIFYANSSNLSSGVSYFLSKEVYYPSATGYNNDANRQDNNRVSGAPGAITATKVIDIDIDSYALTTPKVLGGTFVANIPYGFGMSDNAAYWSHYCIVTFKKLGTDGATETDLLTLTSNTLGNDVGASAGEYSDIYFCLKGTLPRTKFIVGQKIRITVEFWTTNGTAGKSCDCAIYLDANNRAITAPSTAYYPNQSAGFTQMSFAIPFRIDI